MYLIIGLGNPGLKYKKTRHNAGALIIEKILTSYILHLTSSKNLHAKLVKSVIRDKQCLLATPTTFMNDSGRTVQALASYYKIKPQNIIIISDDIALPLGTVRIRSKGSAGGHQGLQSIIKHLGTPDFTRIRTGIGPQPDNVKSEKYVLQKFKKQEWDIFQNQVIPKALNALKTIISKGVGETMNDYN